MYEIGERALEAIDGRVGTIVGPGPVPGQYRLLLACGVEVYRTEPWLRPAPAARGNGRLPNDANN